MYIVCYLNPSTSAWRLRRGHYAKLVSSALCTYAKDNAMAGSFCRASHDADMCHLTCYFSDATQLLVPLLYPVTWSLAPNLVYSTLWSIVLFGLFSGLDPQIRILISSFTIASCHKVKFAAYVWSLCRHSR
ncbi:hypothetical protein U1Q18_038907 [Sarracenia purpurea var. burkii]